MQNDSWMSRPVGVQSMDCRASDHNKDLEHMRQPASWAETTQSQVSKLVPHGSMLAVMLLKDFVVMGRAEARQWLRPDADRARPRSATNRSQRQPTQSIHVVPASRVAACDR